MENLSLVDTHRAVERMMKDHGIGTPTISDVLDALNIKGSILDSRIGFVKGIQSWSMVPHTPSSGIR